MTYPIVLSLAVLGYLCGTGFALAYLVNRRELMYRVGSLATMVGWVCHTAALGILTIGQRRPPLGNLDEALSTVVWVVVLIEQWMERRHRVKMLGGFVLPVVLLLSLKTLTRAIEFEQIRPALGSRWIFVHIALVTMGIAAFVMNFAGAVMYLLQERQLKSKRPGTFYYRLPSLETLDRLTYRMLALGFPFLTTGLILGAVWAGTAWGSVFTLDPLVTLSPLVWAIYAATLAGRAAAGWHGRRAAYFAVLGFAVLALTISAGLFLPGRHGTS